MAKSETTVATGTTEPGAKITHLPVSNPRPEESIGHKIEPAMASTRPHD